MKRRLIFLVLMVSLAASASAFAKNGNGRGHGNSEKAVTASRGPVVVVDNRRVHHESDHDRRPPGWSKGKKRGWGDCDLPPGQAKKHGCYKGDRHAHHVVVHHVDDRDRHHDRDTRDGRPTAHVDLPLPDGRGRRPIVVYPSGTTNPH